jgi:hypothetical protein
MPNVKRGARKAFREWLNEQDRLKKFEYRNGRYRQMKRLYGDYVYAQDREMFDFEFGEAMRGAISGWDPKPWIVPREDGSVDRG